jgi:hypothetical protein
MAGLEELPKRAGCVNEAVGSRRLAGRISRACALAALPLAALPLAARRPPRRRGAPRRRSAPPLLLLLAAQVPKQLVEFVDQGGNPDEYFLAVRLAAWRPGLTWRLAGAGGWLAAGWRWRPGGLAAWQPGSLAAWRPGDCAV